MWRRHKPSLQTDNSIKEIITTTAATAVTLYTTTTKRNYVALYIIGKDITYRDILRRNKKESKAKFRTANRDRFSKFNDWFKKWLNQYIMDYKDNNTNLEEELKEAF